MMVEEPGSDVPKPTRKQIILKLLTTCPPHEPVTTIISLVLLLGLIYGTLWGLIGPPVLPGGPVFGLFALAIASFLGGRFVKLFKIPTLVGMMVIGFVLRNAPPIAIAEDIPEDWANNIRNVALVLILLRAGLEVDSDILKKNKGTCSKLIFIPFIFEAVTGALAAHYLLKLPWLFSFLMGFLLSAVSPAVVLPVMLKLQKKGIGTENGIPTMVIAVAGIDDVLALTGFEVILGITFSTGSLGWTIAQGPLEVLAGIIYGVLLGFIFWHIPNPDDKSKSVFRFMLLLSGGLFVLFVSSALDWGAAGAIGCICLPFVSGIRWKAKDWDDEHNPVAHALAFVWRIIEPFLFGLVGSEIRINYLQPSTVGLGLATLFIALALRMIASLIAAFTAGFTIKEQIFVTFAGLPKATVQAAIGPVALTYARKYKSGPEWEEYGIQILTVAVLAILITAPLGATAIATLAPKLLEKSPTNSLDNLDEKSRPNGREVKISVTDNSVVFDAKSDKEENKLSGITSDTSSIQLHSMSRL